MYSVVCRTRKALLAFALIALFLLIMPTMAFAGQPDASVGAGADAGSSKLAATALANQDDLGASQVAFANQANANNSVSLLASKSKLVKVSYKDSAFNKVFTRIAHYSDSYFTVNSEKVQDKLAKLSMLADTVTNSKSHSRSLMKQCGFECKYQNLKATKNDNDNVSYIVGTKRIKNFTLVAVWVKGTGGDYQWVSNFNLGKGKVHEGFSIAESKLAAGVEKYLKAHKITGKKKWWVTGRSRGGAVANLYAKRLTDAYGSKNVYAYTFATPRVSTAAKKGGYKNVKNYLNPGDLMTELPPSKWGYKRYGQDITLSPKAKKAMTKTFKSITGRDYRGYSAKEKRAALKVFLKYVGGKSVDAYYERAGGVPPVMFCQNGLGYMLAGDPAGYVYALGIAVTDPKAMALLRELAIDGGVSGKLAHAHCPTSYLSWLDAMYK